MAIPWFFKLYGGVAAIACLVYLRLFLKDRDTPITDTGSWMVLVVATLFWPITLPISLKKELWPRWQGHWQQWSAVESFPDVSSRDEHAVTPVHGVNPAQEAREV